MGEGGSNGFITRFVFLTEQVTSALRKHFFFFNLSKDYLKSTEEFINQPHRTHTQSHWKLTETVKPHFTHLLKFPILRLHYLRVTSLPGTTFFLLLLTSTETEGGGGTILFLHFTIASKNKEIRTNATRFKEKVNFHILLKNKMS